MQVDEIRFQGSTVELKLHGFVFPLQKHRTLTALTRAYPRLCLELTETKDGFRSMFHHCKLCKRNLTVALVLKVSSVSIVGTRMFNLEN